MAEPFGLSLTFTWDALGRRTKVEDFLGGVTTTTYDVLGQLTKREFGSSGQTLPGADFPISLTLAQ